MFSLFSTINLRRDIMKFFNILAKIALLFAAVAAVLMFIDKKDEQQYISFDQQ